MSKARTTAIQDLGLWEERGARLINMEAVFSASSTASAWQELIKKTQLQEDSAARQKDTTAFTAWFAALPVQIKQYSLYLTGDVHSMDGKEGLSHWHLHWRQSPSGDPPSQLVESSAVVGGYPEVLSRILSNWPGSKQIEVTVSASYALDPKRFKKLPGRMHSKPKPIELAWNGAKHSLKPRVFMTSWEVEPPVGCLGSISLMTVNDNVTAVGNGVLKVDLCTDVLEMIDRQVWEDALAVLGNSP
jgi:hypothetical protein